MGWSTADVERVPVRCLGCGASAWAGDEHGNCALAWLEREPGHASGVGVATEGNGAGQWDKDVYRDGASSPCLEGENMRITKEQEQLLTESKYWKPEIGRVYLVVMGNWRFELKKFVKDNKEGEARPTLVFDIVMMDGNILIPAKEFNTSNKNLCKQLMKLIREAELIGVEIVRCLITRQDNNHYVVDDASKPDR